MASSVTIDRYLPLLILFSAIGGSLSAGRRNSSSRSKGGDDVELNVLGALVDMLTVAASSGVLPASAQG